MKFICGIFVALVVGPVLSFAKPSSLESGIRLWTHDADLRYSENFSFSEPQYVRNFEMNRQANTCLASFTESFERAITDDSTGKIESWADQFVRATGVDKVRVTAQIEMSKGDEDQDVHIVIAVRLIKGDRELDYLSWFGPRLYEDWEFGLDVTLSGENISKIPGPKMERGCFITSETIFASLVYFQNKLKEFEDKVQDRDSNYSSGRKIEKYGRITNSETGVLEAPNISLEPYNADMFARGRPYSATRPRSVKELFSSCQPLERTPFKKCSNKTKFDSNRGETFDIIKGEISELSMVASNCKIIRVDFELNFIHCLTPDYWGGNKNPIINVHGNMNVISSSCDSIEYDSSLQAFICNYRIDTGSHPGTFVKYVFLNGLEIGDRCESLTLLPQDPNVVLCRYYQRTGSRSGSFVQAISIKTGDIIVNKCDSIEYDSSLQALVCNYRIDTGSHPGTFVKYVFLNGLEIGDRCESLTLLPQDPNVVLCRDYQRTGSPSGSFVQAISIKTGDIIVNKCDSIEYVQADQIKCTFTRKQYGSRLELFEKIVNITTGEILLQQRKKGDGTLSRIGEFISSIFE